MERRAVERLTPFAPVAFDLDGTLVRLRVDWREAQAAMARLAARRFGKEYGNRTVWGMLREATGEEGEALDEVLRGYEIEGGRRALPLPLAGVLPGLSPRGVGVVTLNCHACCEEALRATGLDTYVRVIVAREDAGEFKPNPEPLLLCVERLRGKPEEAVFVGDRARDRETAERAGMAFLDVRDLLAT